MEIDINHDFLPRLMIIFLKFQHIEKHNYIHDSFVAS